MVAEKGQAAAMQGQSTKVAALANEKAEAAK